MQKFDIILADCPWSFRVWSKPTGSGRSAESYYPTMTLEDLKSLDVDSVASDNCVLFLWATCPNLKEAFEVLDAWGFEYKTIGFNWCKTNKKQTEKLFWGLGYWSRANSELCLLATRGKPKRVSKSVHQVLWEHEEDFGLFDLIDLINLYEEPLDLGEKTDVNIEIPWEALTESIVRPIQEHSQKPPEIKNRIIELMGDLPRLEMFAREETPGWISIGNEIDGKDIRDSLAALAAQESQDPPTDG